MLEATRAGGSGTCVNYRCLLIVSAFLLFLAEPAEVRQWALSATARFGGESPSGPASNAEGPPNVVGCSQGFGWAPAAADRNSNQILLTYAQSVPAIGYVRTYNNWVHDSVYRIEVQDRATLLWHVLWDWTIGDLTSDCPTYRMGNMSLPFNTDSVRITTKSGCLCQEEIEAVELVSFGSQSTSPATASPTIAPSIAPPPTATSNPMTSLPSSTPVTVSPFTYSPSTATPSAAPTQWVPTPADVNIIAPSIVDGGFSIFFNAEFTSSDTGHVLGGQEFSNIKWNVQETIGGGNVSGVSAANEGYLFISAGTLLAGTEYTVAVNADYHGWGKVRI